LQLGVDAVDVLLLHESTQTLEYAAGRGFRTQALRHTRLRLGEGFAGRVALERRMLNAPDLEKDRNGFLRSPYLAGEEFVAYYGAPLVAKGKVQGVLEIFHRRPLNPDRDWLAFLETLATQAAIAVENTVLFTDLQRSNVELSLAYDTTLEGWSRALDLRDKETEGHTQRVTELAVRLARAMGMGEGELVHVRRGGLLHDIGKMGISDSILLKPGQLTPAEWEMMRMHPVFAYRLLSPIAFLNPALDIPYCHHEKWDGTGYPRGLKGEEIPLVGRIFAVVDVWDALSSDRPYREAWPKPKVREYIQQMAGQHFDPKVADLFLKMVSDE
jgi:HD-GYP domain-containing protein (c-di-GMP phosphodiesterase class II)